MTETKKDNRRRNWTFLVYPEESAVENWREILEDTHVQWTESPIHDKDLKEDGTPKKAHIHVVMAFKDKKSYEQVLEFTESIGATRPEYVKDMRQMIRYLAHLDNKNKAQYEKESIIPHNGMEIEKFLQASGKGRREIIHEITEFVRENHVQSFADLADYAYEHGDDWYEVITDRNTLFLKEYIKSYTWKSTSMKRVNLETGEVIEKRER